MERTIISFDYAIKYILRDKANFDILSGFLTELLNKQVSVQEILESLALDHSEVEGKHIYLLRFYRFMPSGSSETISLSKIMPSGTPETIPLPKFILSGTPETIPLTKNILSGTPETISLTKFILSGIPDKSLTL